jgi:hypothetical protein
VINFGHKKEVKKLRDENVRSRRQELVRKTRSEEKLIGEVV